MPPKRDRSKKATAKKATKRPKRELKEVLNALYFWDITVNNPTDTADQFKVKLKAVAKQWVFQLEEGKNGTRHFQVRLNLHERQRGTTIIAHLAEAGISGHVSETQTKMITSFSYVMKAETRVDGPWSDKDMAALDIPERIRRMEMWHWQRELTTLLENERSNRPPNFDRLIWVIIDVMGCGGKTTYQKMMAARNEGQFVPPMPKTEDMLAAVMALSKPTTILVNLPRGYEVPEEKNFWTGCESIKDGYVYDKRHTFKHKVIDSPQLVVFTNHRPIGIMSHDRWKLKLLHNGKLFEWKDERYEWLKAQRSLKVVEETKAKEPTDEEAWKEMVSK